MLYRIPVFHLPAHVTLGEQTCRNRRFEQKYDNHFSGKVYQMKNYQSKLNSIHTYLKIPRKW